MSIKAIIREIRMSLRELWKDAVCGCIGHEYTPIGPQYVRSHCKRCGIINPKDWGR